MNNAQSGACSTPDPGASAQRAGIAPGLIFLSFVALKWRHGGTGPFTCLKGDARCSA